ncbi:hypothetical protein EJB05_12642, partial [Eragrostis curvula]
MAEATPPSWAEIPRDLASKVLSLLPTHADRVRFAAVCPQWRAAARQLRLPRPLPVLALPDGTIYSCPDGKPLHFPGLDLAGFKTACGNWLVFLRDEDCFLVDPFAGATVTLPALSHVRPIPPDAVARYVMFGNVAMFYPFATWMHIIEPNKIPGKLYAIDQDENLLVVNISEHPTTGNPQVSQIEQVIKGNPFHTTIHTAVKKKIYLVESCGTLLMVRRKVHCRVEGLGLVAGQNEFEVFKADLEQSLWVNVKTLGDDQMLFLGRPCSRAVSASQYRMSGDQIFFLDDIMENDFEEYTFEEEISSVSAYNMRTGEVSSPLPMVWNHKMITAAWLFPCD